MPGLGGKEWVEDPLEVWRSDTTAVIDDFDESTIAIREAREGRDDVGLVGEGDSPSSEIDLSGALSDGVRSVTNELCDQCEQLTAVSHDVRCPRRDVPDNECLWTSEP